MTERPFHASIQQIIRGRPGKQKFLRLKFMPGEERGCSASLPGKGNDSSVSGQTWQTSRFSMTLTGILSVIGSRHFAMVHCPVNTIRWVRQDRFRIEEGTAPVTRDGWMRYALSTGTIRMSKRRILFRSGICLVLISQPPVAGFPSLVDSMQPSVKG